MSEWSIAVEAYLRLKQLSSKNSTACKSGINVSCGSFADGSGFENLEIKGRLTLVKMLLNFERGLPCQNCSELSHNAMR